MGRLAMLARPLPREVAGSEIGGMARPDHTPEELLLLGYTPDEIKRVFGDFTAGRLEGSFAEVQRNQEGDGWTPWLLTSSSNVAAIRYNSRSQELQVQFHPESVKKRHGGVSKGRSAGLGHRPAAETARGGRKLPAGYHPHGHDTGDYPRFTAPSFSEGYGPIYAYSNVPAGVWSSFESASASFGKYHYHHLRTTYAYRRVS